MWSLKDCITYAVENNVTVKKSVLDKTTTEVNYQQQKYNRLPSVAGSLSANLSNGSAIDPVTSDFVDQQIFSNNVGINAQMILFQGNSLNLQIEKNEILVKQSELYLQEAKNNITLSVLESYLQALYYYEGIKIAENALASSKEELSQAQKKYDNGAIAKLELTDLETQHSNNQYTLVSNKNMYDQQVLSLKQLLELDPSTDFQIENISLEGLQILIPDKQEVFAKASELLPDLKIYDLNNESLEKDVKIAKAGYFPTLSLTAGLNSGYPNTMDFIYREQLKNNFSQQVGLSLSIPVFSKKQNKTNVKLAKLQIEQNELDKIAASKTLYSKIETIYQNAVANQAQQNASETARNNAKLSYELAGKKYEFGGLTATELSVSRNTYLNAEQTYLQSKYLTSLYQQLLKFYQGESLTE
ncbi:TolC family protein [Paenimyroides marinum]